MNLEAAKAFVYRNARPLQLAIWNYFFENGSREEVLHCMSVYQNPDGGFGYGMEADNSSPCSSPMQTWKATDALWKIGHRDAGHPLVQGILRYLDSGKEYSEETRQWKNCVESTNDFPHAIWWEYKGEPTKYTPNPTASLAGFLLYFADKDSSLYQKGAAHAKAAYQYLEENFPIREAHVVICYIQLYQYCLEAGITELFDMERFKKMLIAMVHENICPDVEKWGVDYVATPMWYIDSPESIFYPGNEDLVKKEIECLEKQQLPDGSFKIPWNWGNDYREFTLAENWWKSEQLIEKALFFRAFEKETAF